MERWLAPCLISIALWPAGLDHDIAAPCGTEVSTIATRFAPPVGFERVEALDGSFGNWLRALPLQPEGWPVHLYNGHLKGRQDVHAAVIQMSVGTRDLQQCADAVMRLRAEYLYSTDQQDAIAFHFTNGFLAEWTRWRQGERIDVQGNTCRWLRRAEPDGSHAEFMRFLTIVFTYAGTLSLEQELTPTAPGDLRIGDVFIDGGSPGHAVIVVDAARDDRGRTAFLVAQSYMPAQEIHVLKDPDDDRLSPWFIVEQGSALRTPEWTFDWGDLSRFP